eukprot:5672537-Amphidinium_carterae.1
MAKDIDSSVLCRVLSAHLNHSISCDWFEHQNHTQQGKIDAIHLHPSLEEALGHDRLVHAKNLLSNETARLVSVLVYAQRNMASLLYLDLDWDRSLDEQVSAWLQAGW